MAKPGGKPGSPQSEFSSGATEVTEMLSQFDSAVKPTYPQNQESFDRAALIAEIIDRLPNPQGSNVSAKTAYCCPLHHDTHQSGVFFHESGQFFCSVCGSTTRDMFEHLSIDRDRRRAFWRDGGKGANRSTRLIKWQDAPSEKAKEQDDTLLNLGIKHTKAATKNKKFTSIAKKIGVGSDSTSETHVGWNSTDLEKGWNYVEQSHWTIPELDAQGHIIGLQRRYEDGSKKQLPGTKRGLVYTRDLLKKSGPILVVEGWTDTCALLTMGIRAVGRPSNNGGIDLLDELLEKSARDGTKIFIVGENDRKASGLWPGRDGAKAIAKELTRRWGIEVEWGLPPNGSKDVRAWLNSQNVDPEDKVICARLGCRLLDLLGIEKVSSSVLETNSITDNEKFERKCSCKKGITIWLKNKLDRPGEHQIRRFGCKCISCEACGPQIRSDYLYSSHVRLDSCRDGVFVREVTDAELNSVAQAIYRNKGKYWANALPNGCWSVYSNVRFRNARQLDVNQSYCRMRDELAAHPITGRKKSVHTSRGWGMIDFSSEVSRWEKVAVGPKCEEMIEWMRQDFSIHFEKVTPHVQFLEVAFRFRLDLLTQAQRDRLVLWFKIGRRPRLDCDPTTEDSLDSYFANSRSRDGPNSS